MNKLEEKVRMVIRKILAESFDPEAEYDVPQPMDKPVDAFFDMTPSDKAKYALDHGGQEPEIDSDPEMEANPGL